MSTKTETVRICQPGNRGRPRGKAGSESVVITRESRGLTGKVQTYFVVSSRESNFICPTRLVTLFSCHIGCVELDNVSKNLSGFLKKKPII